MVRRGVSRQGGGFPLGRLLIAGAVLVFSLVSYYGTQSKNGVTQEVQHIDITPEQEIAIGLQAAPEMADQFGGLDRSQNDAASVKQVGQSVVANSPAGRTPYPFDFHLLADRKTVNAFALPGGQIFITRALYDQLTTEAELAGVLGHEAGHVVARHSAEQLARAKLMQGLTGAAILAACDPNDPRSCAGTAQVAALVGQLVNMKYSREDESQSDWLGVCFMRDAGYDPSAMAQVMEILAAQEGDSAAPEFTRTHPSPANRLQQIRGYLQNLDQCPR